ncbi:MAG: hypothetical protein WDM88_06150 [Galbitalea sp.]
MTAERDDPSGPTVDLYPLAGDPEGVRLLDADRLLGVGGRVGIRTARGAHRRGHRHLPRQLSVHDRKIYFAAVGIQARRSPNSPGVAFECDGVDGTDRWSVVVRGVATRIGDDAQIVQSGVLDLSTLAPGEKFNYVCITPQTVSGREFPGRA